MIHTDTTTQLAANMRTISATRFAIRFFGDRDVYLTTSMHSDCVAEWDEPTTSETCIVVETDGGHEQISIPLAGGTPEVLYNPEGWGGFEALDVYGYCTMLELNEDMSIDLPNAICLMGEILAAYVADHGALGLSELINATRDR